MGYNFLNEKLVLGWIISIVVDDKCVPVNIQCEIWIAFSESVEEAEGCLVA